MSDICMPTGGCYACRNHAFIVYASGQIDRCLNCPAMIASQCRSGAIGESPATDGIVRGRSCGRYCFLRASSATRISRCKHHTQKFAKGQP